MNGNSEKDTGSEFGMVTLYAKGHERFVILLLVLLRVSN